jgi:hypothetical protein
VPAKPILALISYKNLTSAKIAIYRLNEQQLNEYNEGYSSFHSQMERSEFKLGFVKKLGAVQTKEFNWPDMKDYRSHSLEVRIDPLPPGNYVLVVKDAATDNEKLIELNAFKISRLATIGRGLPNGNIEIRVMDRETGVPLDKIKVHLKKRTYSYNSTTRKNEWVEVEENGISNKDGLYQSKRFLGNDNLEVKLVNSADTLTNAEKNFYGARDNSDDDEVKDKTLIFTDRQIYRPGQVIYFKGLQVQTISGKSKIVPDKNVEVKFLDVNNKQVSLLKAKTNEYGTFSGSFIIPQVMLNGNVTLSTDDGEIEVRVEEYKRPTFQVEFLPVKESYKLNDSVTVMGTVTAFSGYGLSQAKVAYHITRSQQFTFVNNNYGRAIYGARYNYNPEVTEIVADTTATDDQGNFKIKFKAIPRDPSDIKNTNYSYAITADVTDASGETHSSAASVNVGNNSIKIVNYLPEQMFAADTLKIPASIQNLNGRLQKGEIKIEVYALQTPGKAFKNRLWQDPDQYILSATDFAKDFPAYAYRHEDMVSSWKTLNRSVNLDLKVDGENWGFINLSGLKEHAPGRFKVVMHARSQKGDTTSTTQYVDLVGDHSSPLKFEDWLVPVRNAVRPGDTATFLAGLDHNVNVLIEKYSGSQLISSKWTNINGQQLIPIPISATDKNIAVQFMMVYKNRLLTSYQRITVINPDQDLKMKFLTFRNKLQPGEKEQWKLRVSNPKGDKYTAEMLAALYDASLDDITPPQNWKDALNPQAQYLPNYYAWFDDAFVNAVNTFPIDYQQAIYNPLTRKYEQLNFLGYNYYGGYNSSYQNYLQRAKRNVNLTDDKQLNEKYLKNAALIKNGYDVTGKVIASSDKFKLPGVSIRIKGTDITIVTNTNGIFKIKVPVNGVLVFSYIGYYPQEIKTTKGENITVTLKENASMLNEIVVVGYSAQKKRDVTGAVTSVRISGRNFAADANVINAEQMLQGKAAGVTVINQGAPGAGSTVFIRGISNFGDAAKPITIRKNFAETAFFYPQLHTNEKGEILIDFTIPEALTRWKFRALAHTKDLATGYIENTVVTQNS